MKCSNADVHAHEGMRRRLEHGCLPCSVTGPDGTLVAISGMYWCTVTGEAWAAVVDSRAGEFQLFATGLYFVTPFRMVTRSSARMLVALLLAAGYKVTASEQPDGDTKLCVVTRNGYPVDMSASLLAANVARYAFSANALVQNLIYCAG